MENLKGMILEIQRRTRDYDQNDLDKARNELVRRWQAAHPEAVKETSAFLHPLILIERVDTELKKGSPDAPSEYGELWANDIYQVTVRRWKKDPVFGSDGPMFQLGISALDGSARHDWRDMQAIKNQLAGPECEAFELFPAESRLMDPSNYYTLWCFPGVKQIRVGNRDPRRVFDAHEAMAPQRAFPK